MESVNHDNINYAKGGKIIAYKNESAKFKRIGIEDKYMIEAITEIGLQGINFDSETILKRISSQFQNLLETYTEYLINQDSEYITNYMTNEIDTKEREGASLEVLDKMRSELNNEIARQKVINEIAETQRESLIKWIDYLKQSEYSVQFKFVILNAVLNYNYDIKTNKLIQRNNETIRNFTPFDAGTLSELYLKDSDYLLLDYNTILNENSQRILQSRDIIEETSNGKWIKFNGGKKTPETEISTNAKELMQLVQNTYWCTKSNAYNQLKGGDFYVYVTQLNDEIYPRIAIRMNEDKVGEVRGNRSSAQDIEDDMLPIAEDFLIKNIPNDSGVKWLNSIRFNQKCVKLKDRLQQDGLFDGFIFDYIKIIGESKTYNVDYGSNGNVAILKNVVNDKIEELPNQFYSVSDIVSDVSKLTRQTKYFIGDLGNYNISKLRDSYGMDMDLSNWELIGISGGLDASNLSNLGKLEIIGGELICGTRLLNLGNLNFVGQNIIFSKNRNITSLGNLEHLGGSLVVNKCNNQDYNSSDVLNDLGKLKTINGDLVLTCCDEKFDFSELEHIKGSLQIIDSTIDFKNLKKIDGDLIIKGTSKTNITDLKNIEYIGKSLDISSTKIKVFEKLKFIGGYADFSNNFTSSTQNIETILGDVRFLNSRIMEFPKLKKIGGNVELRGSFFKSFGNIKYIGGNVNLLEGKVEDLGSLEYIGGYVNFKGSKIETLKNLKKVVKFANFEGSNVVDLENLESIGGNAYFSNSKVKSLGKLKFIGGFAQFHNMKQLEQEWNERQMK